MAELRDEYLDYLNTSGLLDESRFSGHEESRSRRPSSSMRERRPGERLPSWGGGDVDEPLISPGDLYGPIASKLGKETADILVPYLMQSVSRMAPLITEAMQAAREGSRGGAGIMRSQRGSLGGGRPRPEGTGGEGKDPLSFLSPEQRARLEAMKRGKKSTGSGDERLLGDLTNPEVSPPQSYTEGEQLEDLSEKIRHLLSDDFGKDTVYPGHRAADIAPQRIPSGEWPATSRFDESELAELLKALQATSGAGRSSSQDLLGEYLKATRHGGASSDDLWEPF